VITLSLITSTMIHATNGDNLIAVGAKARGMGGVGMAVSHGAESGLGNAALITSVEDTEIAFGGTIFMPDINTQIAGFGPSYNSDADMNMIPEVSIAHKIDDNWYIGIGMWGTAGLGVDYSDATLSANNFNMVTNLQLMQFGVPIAYKTGGLSLAVTPIVQYGNLDINYDGFGGPVGSGLAQDFGFGYNLGLAYDFSANGVAGLTFGATYKSSIEMDYEPQLSTAMEGFNVFNFSDKLEQPEEYGVGLAYEMGQHTFAFDYKKIKWSDAEGYGDFGWDDSDVYAVGYSYTENEWTVRLGYNHADSAVVEQDGTTYTGALFNTLNLLGFPANAEDHYTIGASYEVTKSFSVDLAYVYEDEASDTFNIAGLTPGATTITTTHEENSVSFQLAYKF
ncbi:porin, partial [Sulfurovum sp.]|uniref:OmpP1/FadL family transporter n=1 Tax=Sulfurovum sp. TaxID=1969726 RepID=UPI0028680626